ncbi:hypothetical protein BC835DRAFT_1292984 [Cytidiella melzeri]|nr:hypothetical protein BC835DRAFT_1292984 [Cytidiella melzeri]
MLCTFIEEVLTDNVANPDPQVNDIKVVYHKAAGRSSRIFSFNDFRQEKRTIDIGLSKSDPWKPFKSRLDFEFAEFTQKASLNQQLVNDLFKLVKDAVNTPANLTLKSADDVNTVWESAKLYHPSFSSTKISKPYKDTDQLFDFHSRPLWDWILSQVQDPLLAPYMEWDAQRHHQSDISEVCSGAKPLAIILWADTSVLSTFGTQKGHFIVARVGNLPMWIRNGKSWGGGRIVGFLPIPEGMVGEQGKPGFVDWKNAVYHEAFRVFLEDVARISKLGEVVRCGDGIPRILFPYIHVLSADYEEQCHFALIRGLLGKAPCPVCLVPKGGLSDLKTRYAYRTAASAQILVTRAESKASKGAALKAIGLRNNALWAVANTDVHEAISYDRLHVDIIGVFQKHILPEIKIILKDLGRKAQAEVDETFKTMARWSDLAHFKTGILTLDFSDGKKWADAARILLHATYNVMGQAQTPKGFALLRLFRKWHELNMYLSFEVHTEDTIAAYERTVDVFHDRLDYTTQHDEGDDVKDWDGIIKIHAHIHAARDIRRKGVIANMDTKVNENLNGPMRRAYRMQTNFKNVEPQLGRIEDRAHVCCFTRAHIEAMDQAAKKSNEPIRTADSDEEPEGPSIRPRDAWVFGHVYVGSRRKTTFSDFARQSATDDAFINLRRKLSNCLGDLLSRTTAASSVPPPPHQVLHNVPPIRDSDTVLNCSYMLVDFEHKVSWRTNTDRLYCRSTPDYNTERFDCALIHMSDTEVMFCRLVRIFVYSTGEQKFALALIQPMATVARRADAALALCRLREKPRRESMVVPARSIIRGAVIVPDRQHDGEYTLMDGLDTDHFLRMMSLFQNRDMEIVQ